MLLIKRVIFYTLSFTWGAIMSLIGLVVVLIGSYYGRVKTYHGRLYVVCGENWGGLDLGCFFICCRAYTEPQNERYMAHECGHGLQNIIWGPLFIFVIQIPSAIRYWYRTITKSNNKPYDSIWFEGQATKWGLLVANDKW